MDQDPQESAADNERLASDISPMLKLSKEDLTELLSLVINFLLHPMKFDVQSGLNEFAEKAKR